MLSGLSSNKDSGEYQFNSTFKKAHALPLIGTSSTLTAKAALKQITPIKAKREEPRRRLPERILQERIALKPGERPDVLESQHMDRIAKMGCLVCNGRSTLHHVTGYADKMGRITRSHKCVVPLCAKHHQKIFDPLDSNPVSVEGLGHQKFFEKHGLDLFTIGNRMWKETLVKLNLPDTCR